MTKYQVGIQDAVKHIILQSKKMNLPYITKQQIIQEVKKTIPSLKNTETKVGQALYQLQQPRKYKRQEIKKLSYNKYTTTPQYTYDMWSPKV